MARTSRGSVPSNAGVDAHALDNLDLDDMFSGEGDDLFGAMDGMDIDLGDMDDITDGKQESKAPPAAAPLAASSADPEAAETPKRRKTKRKVKSPHLFEDDDDDYEPTKKKRRAPPKPPNNKKKKKPSADEIPKVMKGKKGKASDLDSVSVASVRTATAPTSGVAAAGRFGKRGIQNSSKTKKKLPISTSSSRPDKPKAGPATTTATPASSVLQQIIQQHAGLPPSIFCGIAPSSTLFYPFMPTLPPEPSLKHRKVYSYIDRLHSNFLTQLSGSTSLPQNNVTPAGETESIFKLMQDATREEKSVTTNPDRKEQIGHAVGVLRNTVDQMDRHKLAVDLLAMCALLKRQYDFIEQNGKNMDKWCKDNFSESDYADVFLAPPDSQDRKSKLSTFSTQQIKVKLICTGFKEPKSQLVAILPAQLQPKAEAAPKKSSVKKKTSTSMDSKSSTFVSQVKAPPSYAEMTPHSRRKALSVLVARTARELETKQRLQSEARGQLVQREQKDARKSITDDPAITPHTGGMWKWLEKTRYFGTISRSDVERGIEEASALTSTNKILQGDKLKDARGLGKPAGSQMVSCLTSLLVEEPQDSDEGDEESSTSSDESGELAMLSDLTEEERTMLQLTSLGLAKQTASGSPTMVFPPPRRKQTIENVPSTRNGVESPTCSSSAATSEPPDDLQELVDAMVTDLGRLNSVNSARAAYLKRAVVTNGLVTEDAKRTAESEASVIARCQTLLKKSKDSKVKASKPKTAKNDELNIPCFSRTAHETLQLWFLSDAYMCKTHLSVEPQQVERIGTMRNTWLILVCLVTPVFGDGEIKELSVSGREDTLQPLEIEQFEKVLLTEVPQEFGFRRHLTEIESNSLWKESIAKQWDIAVDTEEQATLDMDDGTVPFLICNRDYGQLAGEVIQEIRLQLGSIHLMPLYNKIEMSCFVAETCASKAMGLPSTFFVFPFTLEMKLAQDTAVKIELLGSELSHIEIKLCANRTDEQLLSIGKGIVSELEKESRRRMQTQFQSHRSGRPSSWHRQLREEKSSRCDPFYSSLKVDVAYDTIMLTILAEMREDKYRDCLQNAILHIASKPVVCFVGVYQQTQVLNHLAAGIVQSGVGESTPFFSAGLDGAGQTVALSDTGIDVDNCYFWDKDEAARKDTSGATNKDARKVVQYYASSDTNDVFRGHGTHVAGTIAGKKSVDGKRVSSGPGDGIATAAKIALFDFGDEDGNLGNIPISTILQPGYDAGARIHSASWGTPGSNDYTGMASTIDQFMWEHPDFLFVSAAGNNGGGNRLGSVLSPSTNKNGISVGASQNASPHISAQMSGPDFLVEFSSRGPTSDGRRKPEITAPGSFLLSAKAHPDRIGECDDDDGLTLRSGTSMSAPVIAGTAALLRQYFQEGWHLNGSRNSTAGFNPTASLVKAVLLNGAQPLRGIQDRNTGDISSTTAYDFSQGYGRASLIDSVPVQGQNNLKAIFVNSKRMVDGGKDNYDVVVSNRGGCNEPLQATLAWTDPAGGAFCNQGCVLNDLDMYIILNGVGGRFYPNGLSGEDSTNNVERVRIDQPVDGAQYTIHVAGTRLLQDQDYSLVISGCLDSDSDISIPTASPTASPIQSTNDDDSCQDTSASIAVSDSETEDCKWLNRNIRSFLYLCNFWDVATSCPATCQTCNLVPETSITTSARINAPVDGDRRWFGVQFDIKAKKDIVLESVDLQINNRETYTAEVYGRSGRTGVSRESWELLCRTRVTGQGRNNLVPLDCGASVSVLANDFHNLYVTLAEDSQLIIQSGAGSTNTVLADSSDVTLYAGLAVSYNNRAFFPGYAFTGAVRYATTTTAPKSCEDQNGAVEIDATVGSRTCDWIARNQNRYGFVCQFAGPAQHCPETCQVCA